MKTFRMFPHGVLMATVIGFFVVGSVVEAAAVEATSIGCPNLAAGLPVFHNRIENYAALHRRLAGLLPPMDTAPDVQSTRINRKALALALRASRINAQQGDIFGGPVDISFRCLIAKAERNSEGWLSGISGYEMLPFSLRPLINETYPPEFLNEVPYFLQLLLPAIPEEVEYVVIDNHIVLWDIYAEVVIDVLPNAFGGEFYGSR